MIKQPELGKKITELRKAKGWTQEELVERCNISVRTIQRIETGEVMPRSFTVRTILAALEYDLSQVKDEERVHDEDGKPGPNPFPQDLLKNGSYTFLIKQINLAWIFGLVYFILTFVEAPAEYVRFTSGDLIYAEPFYIALKVVLLVCLFFFYRGFVYVGSMFDNYLVKIVSGILIVLHASLIVYDIQSLFFDSIERKILMAMAAIVFGATGIIYSFALWRLHPSLGLSAQLAAGFEALSGCLLLTVVLAIAGDIAHIPAELFQIIILFKAAELVRKKMISPAVKRGLQPSIS